MILARASLSFGFAWLPAVNSAVTLASFFCCREWSWHALLVNTKVFLHSSQAEKGNLFPSGLSCSSLVTVEWSKWLQDDNVSLAVMWTRLQPVVVKSFTFGQKVWIRSERTSCWTEACAQIQRFFKWSCWCNTLKGVSWLGLAIEELTYCQQLHCTTLP